MKNQHSENKFSLVREFQEGIIKLSSDGGDFSYLAVEGHPIFYNKSKLYLALKFKIKYPFVMVEQYSEFDDEFSSKTTKTFIS